MARNEAANRLLARSSGVTIDTVREKLILTDVLTENKKLQILCQKQNPGRLNNDYRTRTTKQAAKQDLKNLNDAIPRTTTIF